MFAALDVYYSDQIAQAAAVVFDEWAAAAPLALYTHRMTVTADLCAGQIFSAGAEAARGGSGSGSRGVDVHHR
jgi:hypothetical protein